MHDVVTVLQVAASVAIICGYFAMPFTVLRYLRLCRPAMTFGTTFVVAAAITNIGIATDQSRNALFALMHFVQAIALIAFIARFTQQVRRAQRLLEAARRESARTGEAPDVPPTSATDPGTTDDDDAAAA